MKLKSLASLIILIVIQSSCGSQNADNQQKYSGIIESAGMTTYQYGSHKLTTDNEFYALKSDQVDLTIFEGRRVTIVASRIEGYPIEGGPVFLQVLNIEE